MFSNTTSEHMLEIRGPRNIAWRPASSTYNDELREAIVLAHHGRASEAIEKAEDLWIARNGDMHDVRFRVCTKQTILTGKSPGSVLDLDEA